ncbi:MAG TPA: bifunctional riboflavin kinase/FAD synthetase [Burkholderiaceae bacterium]|nr:bifunctional riboflavin kinase/FAD synthetase [Burkholderiaceae bacterium]
MHVFRGLPNADARTPCVLTIGNFDGVHRGHQVLLKRLVELARSRRLPSAVMTFEPHPREYFAHMSGDPSRAPARIANLRDKLEGLAECGVDRVIVERFNARFSSLTAQQFIEDVLVEGCHAKHVLVGDDFRFGAKRGGDFASLQLAGATYGFEVEAMPTVVNQHGDRVSSSALRHALAAADFDRAALMLGRPYSISGRVIHGRKLGRTLGFPTLNLAIHHRRPAVTGIFVTRVHGLADHPLNAVASLGVRPTVEDAGRVLLEPHVLDWQGDAYGRLVRVEFCAKLHDEVKYASLEALRLGIADDERAARAWFAERGFR